MISTANRNREMAEVRNNKTERGLVIVTVLWVVIVIGLIVASIGQSTRIDTKLCFSARRGLQLKWASRAGIETAVAVLNEDGKASDHLRDLWADNDLDFNDIALGEITFKVDIIDEAGKLNINNVTKKQLLTLPEMKSEIADAIIDWRDKDDTPGPAGAEAGYYKNMPIGYKIRNGNFRTIRELLLVKGVNEDLLYGVNTRWIDYLTCYSADNNKDAEEKKRVNINNADENKLSQSLSIKKSYAKWIVENKPKKGGYKSIADLVNDKSPKKAKKSSGKDSNKAEPLDLETFYKIADKLTTTDQKRIQGRVNINTASRTVLTALLGGPGQGEQIAVDIIGYRTNLLMGMDSITDLMKVSSMKLSTFKTIASQITTRSDIYTVSSTAKSDETARAAKLRTEMIIDRNTKPYTVLYWYQGVTN